jgi:hypothetical protein
VSVIILSGPVRISSHLYTLAKDGSEAVDKGFVNLIVAIISLETFLTRLILISRLISIELVETHEGKLDG